MNDYSFKDFTGKYLADRDDMSGLTITNSCFSQEQPGTKNFPENMTGTTLRKCNLDNCDIPPGNFIEDCSQRRFKAQDDGFDWIVDENNNPIERI